MGGELFAVQGEGVMGSTEYVLTEDRYRKVSWAVLKGRLRRDLATQYNRWWSLCGPNWDRYIRDGGKPVPPAGRVRLRARSCAS